MIINQDQTNDLIFYVKSALPSPYYLVYLVSKITSETYSFIVTDLADCDFVVSQMTEPGYSGTNDAVNGILKINSGSYELYLYDQASSSNLDYTLSNSLLTQLDLYVYSDGNSNRTFL